MNHRRKLIFRADGNRIIGMGHFMRSIALAEMLKDAFDCSFALADPSPYQKNEVQRIGASLTELPAGNEHFSSFLNVPSAGDIVVLDNYFFDTAYQEKIRNLRCSLVCIDDMHDRHYLADLVINHSPSVDAGMFSCEPYTKLLLGLDYVLLRKEFREYAVKPGKPPEERSILICFGGSDIHNLSLNYARLLCSLFPGLRINVLMGSAAEGKNALKQWIAQEKLDDRIHFFENLNAIELIDLFEKSMICIVPSSGILFEVISTKRIAITGYFVDNQENNPKKIMHEEKGILFLGDLNDPDEQLLKALIEKSMKMDYRQVEKYHSDLIDGLSGQRILEEFEKLFMLKIRRASKQDMMQYFYWANDPEVRKASFHSKKISLSGHHSWFNEKISDPDSFLFVYESDGELAGQVRIEKKGKTVIGISIDKKFRGKGLAVSMLEMALENYFKTNNDPVYAYIRKDNSASIKSFVKAGFEYFEDSAVNQVECYVYVFHQK